MKCPYCENEMERGKSSFRALKGLFTPMMLVYSSDDESGKGIFKRKTGERIILDGEEICTYYCAACKKIVPVFDEQ